MIIKGINEEDFTNYKKASMFIIFPYCSFKCEKECGINCCQNSSVAKLPTKNVEVFTIVEHYIKNPITHAIVCGGLEPMDSWNDLKELISEVRKVSSDDLVIYTGYWEHEIVEKVDWLKQYPNVIIKFGRYIPGQQSHYDEVLGISLANSEQYAKKIS